jgi:hypothetical protein
MIETACEVSVVAPYWYGLLLEKTSLNTNYLRASNRTYFIPRVSHVFRCFENWALRMIYEFNKEEIIRLFRRSHNEKNHHL